MIPEHQFRWMWVQVILPLEILLVILSYVMIDQHDWNDKRHKPFMVSFDHLKKLFFFFC